MPVQTQMQVRRGTASSWTSTNPTLAAGELGFETDTGKFKIGTGSSTWTGLAYATGLNAITYLFNATGGQTTFSGADANGLTLAYTVGTEQVFLNGALQVRGSDYTATNGTSIVLTSGALASDVLNVIAYSAMSVADTYTQAQANALFIPDAIVDAKGDIIAATASDTVARLAVGTNDLVLTAASGETTGLKYSGGYVSYTPTWTTSGTPPTLGNASVAFSYAQVGKIVNVKCVFGIGSTTNKGSGDWYFTLPKTAANISTPMSVGTFYAEDNGVAGYLGFITLLTDTTRFSLRATNNSTIGGSVPFSWGTGDYFTGSFTYEVA
jgi:hypothetical protein